MLNKTYALSNAFPPRPTIDPETSEAISIPYRSLPTISAVELTSYVEVPPYGEIVIVANLSVLYPDIPSSPYEFGKATLLPAFKYCVVLGLYTTWTFAFLGMPGYVPDAKPVVCIPQSLDPGNASFAVPVLVTSAVESYSFSTDPVGPTTTSAPEISPVVPIARTSVTLTVKPCAEKS